MKAIFAEKYGAPEVLALKEIEKPTPQDDEVLIKVYASSINSADHRTMRAQPFFVRFMGMGLFRPKQQIPGIDMAGIVEAIGKNVTQFKEGDEVYGDIESASSGAYAEYVCVPESGSIVIKPSNMTFEQAAAVPVAGITALQALKDHGQIQAGEKVLVNGASGGVGTFTVMIAKAFGAEVTGVCSARNCSIVRSCGADYVIDYKKQDVTQLEKRYDLIIDIAATITVEGYKRILAPKGRGVLVGFSTMMHMIKVILKGKKAAKKSDLRIFSMGVAKANKEDFNSLCGMMESGKITPAIDKVYPLAEAADAMRYFEEEHARAKVVISICKEK